MPITEDLLKKVEADGFVMLDHLVTGVPGRNFAERKEAYKNLLRNLKPGVTMLIVHLGMNDPELKPRPDRGKSATATSSHSPTPKSKLIKELGLKLTTWRELGKISWKK